MHRLTVVLASTRLGCIGPVITDWFLDRARAHPGFEVQLVGLGRRSAPRTKVSNRPERWPKGCRHRRSGRARVVTARGSLTSCE